MLELLVINWVTPIIVSNCNVLKILQFLNSLDAQSFCCAWFGWGYGNIWLDNVACSGSENSLSACSKNCIGCHNCYHGEDAGARCYCKL